MHVFIERGLFVETRMTRIEWIYTDIFISEDQPNQRYQRSILFLSVKICLISVIRVLFYLLFVKIFLLNCGCLPKFNSKPTSISVALR